MSTDSNQAAAPPAPTAPAGVELETPIVRGDQTITHVSVRKPQSGELRGLSLKSVLNLDVDSLLVLLPRITAPTLTMQDVSRMEPVDLVALGGEVLSFFMSKAELEAVTSRFQTA